ncbi:hypothetical protein JD844_013900, partial [Phrynosoma platyrhinos]
VWLGEGFSVLGALALKLMSFSGTTSHSLRYLRTTVSHPGQGLPQFFIVGYVDDQLFYQYDSISRAAQPRVTWMEKAGAHYWDTETKLMQDREAVSRAYMANLRNHYNQSEEFHTLQKMFGCELRKDGSTGGFVQYAYDRTDHIILDKETVTWTEAEPPVGKVTRQAIGGGQEALICQAHGFYPKEIEATWRKGKEILEHETFRRNIAPNFDGTYHIWLSIEIDPKERNLYQCHVDHASLRKPLVLVFEEHGVNMALILGAIFGIVAVLFAFGITFFFLSKYICEYVFSAMCLVLWYILLETADEKTTLSLVELPNCLSI